MRLLKADVASTSVNSVWLLFIDFAVSVHISELAAESAVQNRFFTILPIA